MKLWPWKKAEAPESTLNQEEPMPDVTAKQPLTPPQAATNAPAGTSLAHPPPPIKGRAVLKAADLPLWEALLSHLGVIEDEISYAEDLARAQDAPGFGWVLNQLARLRSRCEDIREFYAAKLTAMTARREKKIADLEAEKARIERGEA
jgi:hypothetical protein